MGEKICALRKEKNFTQKQLAEKLNVTDKAVSKWERGLSCPDVNTLPLLAEVLGTTVDDLLKNTEKSKEAKKNKDLRNLIYKAVALAMGVATIVLSILGEIDFHQGIVMLGIGLTMVALYLFEAN